MTSSTGGIVPSSCESTSASVPSIDLNVIGVVTEVKQEPSEETSTAAADDDDGAIEAGCLTGYQRILGILTTKQVTYITKPSTIMTEHFW